jgi:hypothetical protein
MSAPPRQPGDGFDVIAGQLRALATVFEQLEDDADGFADRVGEISISGAHTGRCCPEAGEALRAGLLVSQASVDELGRRALDVRDALQDTARNYDHADAAATQLLNTAGADL